ncbi:MAG TPA: zinc-dependent alcohol dehydrogenase [Jatrophihabitans sp.]|uniref:zinc-dependent alcohol dehydrogenase n=1 Tax=Jatrophihabitans sp. TaxID=1932789 RepID=UPI002F17C4CC
MKALCWTGVDELSLETVPDPRLLNAHDAIVKVRLSSVCGSDLHVLGGYLPTMRSGDVLGHEFMGEVVEVGSAVSSRRVGERVVVCSFISCGHCWYCRNQLFSLCDNGNPNPLLAESLWGQAPAGCYGYSHVLGGFAGSHAEYVRVPYADQGMFPIPGEVDDLTALFASDAAPTGWMGADLGGVQPGDVVAVWGAGAVGQLAAQASVLLGAAEVIVIDGVQERLDQAKQLGVQLIDFRTSDVSAELRERTGGRGADVCIEAVGMVSGSPSVPLYGYDQFKQERRLGTDRPLAVREAIFNCRKGGSVFVLGVFGGVVDKFPLGAVMNKGLTLRSAQQHGQRYIPMLLDRMARGELRTRHLATHVMPLAKAAHGYDLFKNRRDGCVRAVFKPGP